MFGEEPANTMENILATARDVVNDDAVDISAFIDLSVLIRDFLCKQPWRHRPGMMSRPASVTALM